MARQPNIPQDNMSLTGILCTGNCPLEFSRHRNSIVVGKTQV